MYTFLKLDTLGWLIPKCISHTGTCILTKWNNKHLSSQRSNRQQAGNSHSDHVRKSHYMYMVVMGSPNGKLEFNIFFKSCNSCLSLEYQSSLCYLGKQWGVATVMFLGSRGCNLVSIYLQHLTCLLKNPGWNFWNQSKCFWHDNTKDLWCISMKNLPLKKAK